jgi:Uncharacterized protein conserved in bacteria (DUF2130)
LKIQRPGQRKCEPVQTRSKKGRRQLSLPKKQKPNGVCGDPTQKLRPPPGTPAIGATPTVPVAMLERWLTHTGNAAVRSVDHLALEDLLRQKFRRDLFEPVPKGEFGGDLVQRVVGPAGQVCGSILWEAKRTMEPLLRPP